MFKTLIALVGASLLTTACTSTATVERRAAGGAAPGALAAAGAGNDTGRGDAVAPIKRQYYDESAGRYLYYDKAAGRYFWEDGQPRN